MGHSHTTNFAGASAGWNSNLTCGWLLSKELFAFMLSFDFKHLIIRNPIREGVNILRKFGLYSNSKLLSEFKRKQPLNTMLISRSSNYEKQLGIT